ncbi:DUF1963 domain-containing protein [Yoonia sp. GPGPB17]|uniref:DUF1963 domain-containing protein n=1 Tax=Yoonia sp. GPGPB17 TaxID=3026147 RepID=UPI004040B6E2
MSGDANTDAPHSCVGGRPSLPKDMVWPLDQDDKPMLFLAQINFFRNARARGLPQRGPFKRLCRRR